MRAGDFGRRRGGPTRAQKACRKCKRFDPPCGFGLHRHEPDDLAPYCVDCNRERQRVYDEKVRAAEAARKRPPVEEYHAYPKSQFECTRCDIPFSDRETLNTHNAMRHA